MAHIATSTNKYSRPNHCLHYITSPASQPDFIVIEKQIGI